VVGGIIARGSRYRTGAANAQPARTMPDGSPIPVFDADVLAYVYWDMVSKRYRPEVIPSP
jgi:hypothetical protein